MNLTHTSHRLRALLPALALTAVLAVSGCSKSSDKAGGADKDTTSKAASAETTAAAGKDATTSTEASTTTAPSGPVIHAAWKNAGEPASSDKPWAVQKAKIEGNKLTLYLYTWEPKTTKADWPWPEPSDYGEGDFFLSVEITAPGAAFEPAVYKDEQVVPTLSLTDLGVSFLSPNGEVAVTAIDGVVTGELRIDDGYAQVSGPFEAMLDS